MTRVTRWWEVTFVLDEGFYVHEFARRGICRAECVCTYGPLVGAEVRQVLDDVVNATWLREMLREV